MTPPHLAVTMSILFLTTPHHLWRTPTIISLKTTLSIPLLFAHPLGIIHRLVGLPNRCPQSGDRHFRIGVRQAFVNTIERHVALIRTAVLIFITILIAKTKIANQWVLDFLVVTQTVWWIQQITSTKHIVPPIGDIIIRVFLIFIIGDVLIIVWCSFTFKGRWSTISSK